jgi:hypothetical protein
MNVSDQVSHSYKTTGKIILHFNIQCVPSSEHPSAWLQYSANAVREIKYVSTEVHTKHTNTLYGQKVEFLNVETGGKLNTGLWTVNGQW